MGLMKLEEDKGWEWELERGMVEESSGCWFNSSVGRALCGRGGRHRTSTCQVDRWRDRFLIASHVLLVKT